MSKTELFDKDVISIGKHNIEFINTPLSDEQLISDVFGADKTMVLDKTPTICLIVTKGKQKNQEFKITNYEHISGVRQKMIFQFTTGLYQKDMQK